MLTSRDVNVPDWLAAIAKRYRVSVLPPLALPVAPIMSVRLVPTVDVPEVDVVEDVVVEVVGLV